MSGKARPTPAGLTPNGVFLIVAPMVQPEQLVGGEWAEWYRLSPAERWLESERLWEGFLALGGSLDPEPDTQSPFFDPRAPRAGPADGRAGVRVVRRGGV